LTDNRILNDLLRQPRHVTQSYSRTAVTFHAHAHAHAHVFSSDQLHALSTQDCFLCTWVAGCPLRLSKVTNTSSYVCQRPVTHVTRLSRMPPEGSNPAFALAVACLVCDACVCRLPSLGMFVCLVSALRLLHALCVHPNTPVVSKVPCCPCRTSCLCVLPCRLKLGCPQYPRQSRLCASSTRPARPASVRCLRVRACVRACVLLLSAPMHLHV